MGKQVMFLVLHDVEKLESLLSALNHGGIKGATVFHSSGMAHSLIAEEDSLIISSLRAFMLHDRAENRTVMMVIDDEKIEVAKKIIYEVVGDLNKSCTGILFAIPVTFAEGIIPSDLL